MADDTPIENFDTFWPFYLGEHRNPLNRKLHLIGTSSALLLAASSLALGPQMLPLALVVGYGPAWIGHFFVENNRPASFKYPLWSFRADLKMLGYAVTGRLDAELESLGIA